MMPFSPLYREREMIIDDAAAADIDISEMMPFSSIFIYLLFLLIFSDEPMQRRATMLPRRAPPPPPPRCIFYAATATRRHFHDTIDDLDLFGLIVETEFLPPFYHYARHVFIDIYQNNILLLMIRWHATSRHYCRLLSLLPHIFIDYHLFSLPLFFFFRWCFTFIDYTILNILGIFIIGRTDWFHSSSDDWD